MRWILNLDGGPRRVNHAAVAIEDRIYSFGGYCSGDTRCRNEPIDVHVLHPGTFRWRQVTPNMLRTSLRERASTSSHIPRNSTEELSIPPRGRARSVADLHPLGQLRFLRPPIGSGENSREDEGPGPLRLQIPNLGFKDDQQALDAMDELGELEVHDEVMEEDAMEMAEDGPNPLFVDIGAVGGAATGADQQEKSTPYQRYGHTVVAYKGKAYLWGGRNDEFGSSQTLHEYDPISNTWSIVPVSGLKPPSRDGHTAVLFNDQMLIFGGFEEHNHRFSQETYAFDFPTKTWTQLRTEGEPPQHRDFHTACVLYERMYVFGGRSDEMGQIHSNQDCYCESLKYLDLRTNVWSEVKEATGEKPSGRRSHSVWTHNNRMYLFGGYQSTKDLHFDDLYEYNPSKNHWRLLKPTGPSPSARRRQCTLAVGNRVFLFGGTMPNTGMAHGKEARKPVSNGTLKDLADLYVLDYEPTLYSLAAEAVIRYGFNRREFDWMLPKVVRNELGYISTPNTVSRSTPIRLDCNNG